MLLLSVTVASASLLPPLRLHKKQLDLQPLTV